MAGKTVILTHIFLRNASSYHLRNIFYVLYGWTNGHTDTHIP